MDDAVQRCCPGGSRSFVILGGCAFTFYVARACTRRGFRPAQIRVLGGDSGDDPFRSLPLGLEEEWVREHRFYHEGWRNELLGYPGARELSSEILFEKFPPDALVFAAGLPLKIPDSTLRDCHGRVFNIHPSRLPDFRGPQPEAQVLLHGELRSAVTVHEVTAQWDCGPILFQSEFDVSAGVTVGQLERFEADIAAEGIESILNGEVNKVLAAPNGGRYFGWYEQVVLDLSRVRSLEEARRRFQLRPEGYAFSPFNQGRMYPIAIGETPSEGAVQLEFRDGVLYATSWVEEVAGSLKYCVAQR